MDVPELIERIRTGVIAPIDAPDEADYHRAWIEGGVNGPDPLAVAIIGGAMADRLAWVFLAGYQATITRCFPTLPAISGWRSFVNTEDQSGRLPGTTLQNTGGARRLDGWKTWLAAAAHVDELIVSAKQNEPPFAVLPRGQAGVHIDEGTPKSYLPEMVQGTVRFDAVEVAENQVVGDASTFPIFRASETPHVRLALNAFILSHSVRLDADHVLTGEAVAGLLGASGALRLPVPSAAGALAALGVDRHTVALADRFEASISTHDEALHQRWMRDRRLVHGASPTIAARAETALAAWRATDAPGA
ncbi:MAG: hypothetical protein AMXMBFR23_05760 [Chloroflexota bacterium]